ncbi:hypothetical protein PUG42_05935 [Erwiniaceae bacterium L1_54_3]|nr:hypothetical protein [Erwiniaceae bacterium L1_54_3]
MTWATFWSAASAIFTFLTGLIALWAVFRWKKQDELKAKLSFKSAIGDYSYVLVHMPKNLFTPHLRSANHQNSLQLIDKYAACMHAWYITEGLLEKNKRVYDDWKIIEEQHSKFLRGEIDNGELGSACISILREKFVFK